MIRLVRCLSTANKHIVKNVCKVTNKDIWKGIPDYDLDVNPYKIQINKNNSKQKKDEKNKSNT